MKDLESSPKGEFSEIAHSYQLSSLQQSAGQVLIKKLKI